MPTNPDGSNSPSMFEKIRGKRSSDINLPADESKKDPKLVGKSFREVISKIPASLEQLRKLGK